MSEEQVKQYTVPFTYLKCIINSCCQALSLSIIIVTLCGTYVCVMCVLVKLCGYPVNFQLALLLSLYIEINHDKWKERESTVRSYDCVGYTKGRYSILSVQPGFWILNRYSIWVHEFADLICLDVQMLKRHGLIYYLHVYKFKLRQ